MRRFVSGLCLVPLLAVAAAAQDRQQWTLQYGPESSLRGGAVVGGVRDPSALYYNPGALWFQKESGVTLTGTAFGFQHLTLDDIAGTGRAVVESDFTTIPTLLAGMFRAGADDKYAVGWGVLTRVQSDLRISGRGEGVQDIVAGNPGPEYFIGIADYRAKITETWIGISSSARFLNDALAIGLSHFLAVRSHFAQTTLDAEAVNNLVGGASLSRDRMRTEYLELGLVWKLGLAADLAPFKVGLTLTSPGVHLRGSGEVDFQQASHGVDLTGDSIPDEWNENISDERREARWARPPAVAVGGSFDFDPWAVHLTMEWVAGIGRYAVIRAQTTPSAPASGGLVYGFRHAQRAVLNIAAAGDRAFGETIRGYVSFRTDFSTLPDRFETVTLASWDLYHLTVGARFTGEKSTFLVGLQFSFGAGGFDQPVNYSTGTEATRMFGGTSSGDVVFLSFQLQVGYTYTF